MSSEILQEHLDNIQQARDDIKQVISTNGIEVGDDIRTYADAIENLIPKTDTSTFFETYDDMLMYLEDIPDNEHCVVFGKERVNIENGMTITNMIPAEDNVQVSVEELNEIFGVINQSNGSMFQMYSIQVASDYRMNYATSYNYQDGNLNYITFVIGIIDNNHTESLRIIYDGNSDGTMWTFTRNIEEMGTTLIDDVYTFQYEYIIQVNEDWVASVPEIEEYINRLLSIFTMTQTERTMVFQKVDGEIIPLNSEAIKYMQEL